MMNETSSTKLEVRLGRARLRYVKMNEAWYDFAQPPRPPDVIAEWSVGIDKLTDGEHDGCYGEWTICFYDFSRPGVVNMAAKHEVFSGEMAHLLAVPDYLEVMQHLHTQAQVEQALLRMGFVDETPYNPPAGTRIPTAEERGALTDLSRQLSNLPHGLLLPPSAPDTDRP